MCKATPPLSDPFPKNGRRDSVPVSALLQAESIGSHGEEDGGGSPGLVSAAAPVDLGVFGQNALCSRTPSHQGGHQETQGASGWDAATTEVKQNNLPAYPQCTEGGAQGFG